MPPVSRCFVILFYFILFKNKKNLLSCLHVCLQRVPGQPSPPSVAKTTSCVRSTTTTTILYDRVRPHTQRTQRRGKSGYATDARLALELGALVLAVCRRCSGWRTIEWQGQFGASWKSTVLALRLAEVSASSSSCRLGQQSCTCVFICCFGW